MSLVSIYVAAFLGSLVTIGILGWWLLWPPQRSPEAMTRSGRWPPGVPPRR